MPCTRLAGRGKPHRSMTFGCAALHAYVQPSKVDIGYLRVLRGSRVMHTCQQRISSGQGSSQECPSRCLHPCPRPDPLQGMAESRKLVRHALLKGPLKLHVAFRTVPAQSSGALQIIQATAHSVYHVASHRPPSQYSACHPQTQPPAPPSAPQSCPQARPSHRHLQLQQAHTAQSGI